MGVPTMRQWTLDLAEDLPVKSSVHVGAIERAGDGLRLVDREAHTIVEADVVGVSAPGPQTARLVDSVDPELATRIREVAFAPTWSLLVELPAATALPFEMLFVNDAGPLRIVVDDSSKPGRPAGPRVVAHATEAWSRAHLEDAPEVVMSVLLEALFEALGIEPVAPVTSSVHRWRFATPSPPKAASPAGHRASRPWSAPGTGRWRLGSKAPTKRGWPSPRPSRSASGDPAPQAVPRLWPDHRVEEEMGTRLGRGPLLQRGLPSAQAEAGR